MLIANHAIEPGPVIVAETLMQFANHSGHACHPIGFILKQGFDACEHGAIMGSFAGGVGIQGEGVKHDGLLIRSTPVIEERL
jgi:hypothetical protein